VPALKGPKPALDFGKAGLEGLPRPGNPARQRGFKKSAEELRMGIPALRQYIDATMPLAPLGKAQQYCSVFNFQLGFFFSSPRLA
jgi:hypothetical protein